MANFTLGKLDTVQVLKAKVVLAHWYLGVVGSGAVSVGWTGMMPLKETG
jgi:hypothetical protein